MNGNTLTTLAIVASIAISASIVKADDELPKSLSTESRVATELDKHATNVRAIDRRFQEALKQLENSYTRERESLRRSLIQRLRKEQRASTENEELDRAVEIRDQIKRLETFEIVAPNQRGEHSTGSGRPANILGTWRWNNGVDIRNLEAGRTSGAGTWRLIDRAKGTYEFQWKKIPADRVTLSPNGRVLEGTKANDPTFRVWAVRID